ncbi:hypothetical protein KYK30_31665 [Shinella yambaruensis]|uniref:Uncharacterized protein n=1 Tax=Shinella yambaruensis TaxID=415996 RepID=A0ABQ5ZTQ4_9HYPH|nr:hypothetical protein [Shinella yambaruensis]MCJ8029991.1 hypothetical protein [Shinella yambaruensis]MCU7984283.1 hypothetical protein [Shinella yambaruensis]GLR55112.1 hypothetical protein GCM10007923_63330 [Shinella yambaruensis]
MNDRDKRDEEFWKAVRRLPLPITCFANGACCPWCGGLATIVRFGPNHCEECEKPYAFGYPEWHEGKDPLSWVPFPFAEFEALGGRADLLPEFIPNDRLKEIYFQKAEERLGAQADMSKKN